MRTSTSYALVGLAVATVLAGVPATSPAAADTPDGSDDPATSSGTATTWSSPMDRGERAETPEDRYALAGGCYRMRSVSADAHLAHEDDGYTATANDDEAVTFHLQATDLGRYLLFDPDESFLALDEGVLAEVVEESSGTSAGAMADGLSRGRLGEVSDEVATGALAELAGRGDTVVAADTPSGLGDWELEEAGEGFRLWLVDLGGTLAVDDDGQLRLMTRQQAGEAGIWTFALDDGCAAWPEAEVNVDGEVVGGPTPYSQTRGYLDAHLHLMASEFLGGRARCARPWHAYGVAHALEGCPEHEDSGGRTHVLETALTGGVDPVTGHDTTGWPTFDDWPRHDLLTYEQVYYRWLERSWRGGLRMFVNLLVDNAVLCEAYPFQEHDCDEMDSVRLQAQRVTELERYIDAQHGGPGQGWFRVVEDPFEARRVMNEGRLAVVLGIEVSRLFDCRMLLGVPQCDEGQIDAQLDEMYDLGVRQMELVNKFDNALSGVAGDPGETGVAVNAGNVIETGRFWQMETCDEGHSHDHGHGNQHQEYEGERHDRRQLNLHDESGAPDEVTGRDSLAGALLAETGRSGAAPAYPEGPHCNAQGLTDLGEHLLHRMMERGMIFDPDHMSASARHEALDIVEAEGYSGVISSHSWADDVVYQRIYDLGGVVTPMAGSSTGFANAWEQHRDWADERFEFGFGFGSDINGFASQGAPRGEDTDDPVTYPFEGFGGVEIDRQVSGERTFDVNRDGVAHYGLYPDWVEDLRRLAGDEIIEDLERGPEAYLQMWERAVGIAPDACREDIDVVSRERLGTLEAGMAPEEVLIALGQPERREHDTFVHCVNDGRAHLTFDADGGLEAVTVEPGPQETDKPDDADDPGATGDERPGRSGQARSGDPDPPSRSGQSSGGQTGAADPDDDHEHGHQDGHAHESTTDRAGNGAAMAPARTGGPASTLPQAALLLAGLAGVAVHGLRSRVR